LSVSASLRATDPLLAGLALEFATTPGRAADATTAFFIAYGLMQLVHGPIGDRFGKLRVVGVQAGLAACATLLCALAPTLDALVAARFFTGLFIGAVMPLSLAWIGDWVPYAARQAVLARVMIGQVAGVAFGLAIGGWFAEHLSWRWSFVMIAALLAVTASMIALALRANPLHGRPPAGTSEVRTHALALLRNGWVRIVLASVFFEAMLGFAALSFIPLHLNRALGLNLAASGALVTLIALGGLCYALTAGRLIRHFGERGLVRYGGLAMALGLAALALAPGWLDRNFALAAAVLALVAMGIGLYALHGTLQVHSTQMAPDARGAGVSTFAFFLFLGQSLGVFFGSLVVDDAGTAPLLLAAAAGIGTLSIAFRRMLMQHKH
jgi:predicted MFS family arabinose efflux permease